MSTIAEEIKQGKFKNALHECSVNILFTASYLNLKHAQFFKEYSLTPPQFNVLRILRGQQGQSISVCSIMDRMIDKSSNASRIIDKLVQKKLVYRTVSKNDRRAVDVVISENGLRLLALIDNEEERLLEGVNLLTNEEATTLNLLLNKIRNSKSNQ
jgi:DNA-binding MarR family transcriptional regulator